MTQMYRVEKVNITTIPCKITAEYGGGYTKEDVEDICKGYTIDWNSTGGIAFRKNGKVAYIIYAE